MAVTKRIGFTSLCGIFVALLSAATQAAVLPEDRLDVMYHSYDGGGVKIDGPSVLMRKSVLDNVSVNAQYYVDDISSASIDVESTASPYSEKRTEYTVGADYLLNSTTLSGGWTNSSENDYDADTYYFGVSQDFFGDLTTLGLSYSLGNDTVGKSNDSDFSEDIERQAYQFSWSQILTPRLLMNLTYHVITDEGFLNNPYRVVRYRDDSADKGYSFQAELYPQTRSSQALSWKGRYFLPPSSAVGFEYRRYRDTWNITGYNLELNYLRHLNERWTAELRYRYYSQNDADFYNDLFERVDAQNFLARDKELSDFTSSGFGFVLSYGLRPNFFDWVEKASVNLAWDRIWYDYKNFRDITNTNAAPGSEPLYQYDADVLRLYASFWF